MVRDFVRWNLQTALEALENKERLAERVGFESTVWLPVQRFSSSMILMLAWPVR
jgi:hypothetical protein